MRIAAMPEKSPRDLSRAAREAIHRSLARRSHLAAVPVTSLLQELRKEGATVYESEEELIHHIVMEATDYGLAVHFDKDGDAS